MYVGVDVGGTKIEAASLVDDELRRSGRRPTPASYKQLLDDVETLCRAVLPAGAAFDGAGVGVPGQVTDRRVEWVPNVHCLDGQDLAGDLGARLGCPVTVRNDAQLALAGEVGRGAARGLDSAVLFSIGTGVGGALMLDGRVVRGSRGAAGALGWIKLDLNHPPDDDHGWLEQYASGRALESFGAALEPPLSPEQVVAGSRAGEAECVALLERVADALGMAAAVVASTFDPAVVLFAGGLADAFDLLESPLREAFTAHASPVVQDTPLARAALGADAALWGAVQTARADSGS